MTAEVEAAVADAFHAEWGRVVATLVRITGDWDLAEECAQDAFATALGALARRRRPAPPRRLAHDGGPQPCRRPVRGAPSRAPPRSGTVAAVAPEAGPRQPAESELSEDESPTTACA